MEISMGKEITRASFRCGTLNGEAIYLSITIDYHKDEPEVLLFWNKGLNSSRYFLGSMVANSFDEESLIEMVEKYKAIMADEGPSDIILQIMEVMDIAIANMKKIVLAAYTARSLHVEFSRLMRFRWGDYGIKDVKCKE